MTKKESRSTYLNIRLKLSEETYTKLNQSLADIFFGHIDLSNVSVLHIFIPLPSKKEPNTWLIIDRLKKDFPQIRISVPRVENDRLVNFYFEGEPQLKKNQWGILEPESGEVTPTGKIDLVIVPLIAFDKKGNRVGYGKGFYDKFLSECRGNCEKIGLSFFEATPDLISVDQHDIPVDAVITPTGIIKTKNQLP